MPQGREHTNHPRSREEFDDFQLDLNPDWNTGQRADKIAEHDEETGRSAADIKDLREQLPGLFDSELKQIPVVPIGTPLEQGSTYLDLRDPQRQPFTAMGGMVADGDHYYVPKNEVDYVLWNRLTDVTNLARVDETDTADATDVNDTPNAMHTIS